MENEEPKKARMSEAEKIDLEIKRIELEMKQFQFEDMKEASAKKKAEREAYHEQCRRRIADLKAGEESRIARCRQCTHRKGGKDVDAIMNGQGNEANYCVIKHQHENGEIHIYCTRCPMHWEPKMKTIAGIPSYAEALRFPTDNVMSGACQFRIPASDLPNEGRSPQ